VAPRVGVNEPSNGNKDADIFTKTLASAISKQDLPSFHAAYKGGANLIYGHYLSQGQR
jgi:hypothetical protein